MIEKLSQGKSGAMRSTRTWMLQIVFCCWYLPIFRHLITAIALKCSALWKSIGKAGSLSFR